MPRRYGVFGLGALLVAGLAALTLAVLTARDTAPPATAQPATHRLTAEVAPAGCGAVAARETSDTSAPDAASEWNFPRDAYAEVTATASAGCTFLRWDLMGSDQPPEVLWQTGSGPCQPVISQPSRGF